MRKHACAYSDWRRITCHTRGLCGLQRRKHRALASVLDKHINDQRRGSNRRPFHNLV